MHYVPLLECCITFLLSHMSHIERFKCHRHDLFTGIVKLAVYICQRSTYMSDITAMEEVFPELGDLTIGMFDMCAENLERNT